VLELDHVFCMVTNPDQTARRLEDEGWVLDAGQYHRGQGTRNRRLVWREQFFELVWVTDADEARTNPLRLDRRARWTATAASPFGLGFRGQLESAVRDEYWLYDALGLPIWIHRDNEQFPERPLVFVLEANQEQIEQRRQRMSMSTANRSHRLPVLREVRLRGPSAPSLPPAAGPPIVYAAGPHMLELVIDNQGTARPIGRCLVIRS
jgi:hypothetical protein